MPPRRLNPRHGRAPANRHGSESAGGQVEGCAELAGSDGLPAGDARLALALVEEEEITPSHADLRAVERETAMQILSGIDSYFGPIAQER